MENELKKASITEQLTKIILVSGFLLISLWGVASNTAYALEQKFTFEFNKTSIKEIFGYIEKHSEFIFMYRNDLLDTSRKVSVKVTGKGIEEVLRQLLTGTSITYEINDRQIILKKRVQENMNPTGQKNSKKLIQGLIKDERGDVIIGATIQVKGTTIGTVTNVDGLYNLTVPSSSSVLVISYIGYETQEVVVGNRQNITITLKENVKEMEEVVITAFGVGQKKENLVGSIQQIRPNELKVPTSNLSSSFAGRLAGVIAVQRSGEPGADGANFWIRGKSTFSGATGALIIIDGMQASTGELNALDPEVIESFSILKDATATAMYGTLGANGVMIVTTKKGENLSKPIINFRVEGSMSGLTDVPQMADGVRFMELYNEAASRSDAPGVPYSDTKITKTRVGENSILYPNINWYDELFKKHSFGQKVNLNIRGGSSKMDYFMSVGVKHNDGNLKSLSKDYYSYNNNINVTRYDFVNNLNLKLTKSTKVSLGLNVGIRDYSGPEQDPSKLFGYVMDSNPVDFPVKYPAESAADTYIRWGGKTGGAQGAPFPNPVAELVSGMKSSFSSTVTANLKLEQKLDMLTKGLKFTGTFFFKNYSTSGVIRSADYNRFEVSSINEETGDYELSMVGNEANTTLVTKEDNNTGNRKIYIQAVLDYNRKFGEHNVNAMFLYYQEQYNTNIPNSLYTSLPQRKQGIAGRLSYGYDNRYLIEVNFGYNGSENFAKGYRFGFFPSIGIGYNISQENYWDKFRDVISNLKLRASWGLVGNDQTGAGRFAYMEDIQLNSSSESYSTGVAGNYTTLLKGPVWNRFYNPNLTWEVGEKLNVGLDLQLLNSLNLNVEVFREIRKNIFQQRATIPEVLGIGNTKVYGNFGKMENKGIDLALDYNKQITPSLFVSFKGTFTYAHNTVLKRSEPDFLLYPNLSVVGESIGKYSGYIANGLFPDQETIDSNPTQIIGARPMPGDLWYQDIADATGNYSNTIDANDKVYMGHPQDPEIIYGFGPSIKWKNFDISMFFQGAARTSLMMSNFFPFGGDKKIRGILDFMANNCWTEDNPNPKAEFPRLKLSDNTNNEVNSSYWLRNAAFLKLKNAEIGYTYKKMRFYISGFNLLTFAPFKYWDPEMGGGNGLKYPTQRTFNIGFQMTIN